MHSELSSLLRLNLQGVINTGATQMSSHRKTSLTKRSQHLTNQSSQPELNISQPGINSSRPPQKLKSAQKIVHSTTAVYRNKDDSMLSSADEGLQIVTVAAFPETERLHYGTRHDDMSLLKNKMARFVMEYQEQFRMMSSKIQELTNRNSYLEARITDLEPVPTVALTSSQVGIGSLGEQKL